METTLTYNIDSSLSLRYRTPVLIISNTQTADRTLLKLLMDDEQEWQKRESQNARKKDFNFPFFRLRPIHSYELLQKLSISQKLVFDGKKMIGDFFSRFTLEYLIEQEANSYVVHALLHNKAVSEYDLILQGSPHIAIHNLQLSFVDPNVAWQELAPFLDGPKKMTKQEYLSFKKEVDPNCLIELEGTPQKETAEPPLLQLVDASCSFAKIANELFVYEKDLLAAGFSKKDLGTSNLYCPTDKSLAAIEQLIKAGWKVVDASGREVVPISRSKIDIEASNRYYKVTASLFFSGTEVPLQTIAPNTRLQPLENGKTGLLAFDKDLKELLREVELVSGQLLLAKTKTSCLTNLEFSCQDAALGTRLRAAFNSDAMSEILPKETFLGKLRPYQQQGLNWLVALYESGLNGLLADEMGLGKTVQVLAFLSHTKGRTLIVMPTSLLYNWKREIEHFLPSKSHIIFHGPSRDPNMLNADIIITSYGTLRSDITLLAKEEFECIILDEAQAIKNSSTQTAQSVFQLQGRFKLSLTGTPVENSVSELACHFHFLEPGLLDSAQDIPLALLRKKIAPFLLRRKKSDVAKDLPEKIDEVVYVTMADEQQLLYDRFVASLKAGLLKKVGVDGLKAHRMEVFEAILRLRQICCHPGLVPQLVEQLAPEATTSGKLDLVLQDIETLIAEGKKIVLFSQFTSMLHLLAKEAKNRGWPHLLLEGQTKDRQTLVDLFQKDSTYPLFLLSLKAGGTGLNLTAADYVLLYDPWWNKAQEAQAIDRAHRIGRKDTVFSKRYYVQGSIEEKILALQEKKGQIAEALFEEHGDTSFSIDDFYELL